MQEIESKIAEYASKLSTLNGDSDKRIKKRVLQTLGKLKKKLLEVKELDNIQKPNASKVLTSHQAKAKVKLLNQELYSFAMKKQLKLAKKRFNWAEKKGLPLDIHTYGNMINAYVRCNEISGKLHHVIFIQRHIISHPTNYGPIL
jgi:hypothetical protein